MWALSSLFQNLGVVAEGMETIAAPIELVLHAERSIFDVGETSTLTLIARYSDGTQLPVGDEATWQLTDDSVVDVPAAHSRFDDPSSAYAHGRAKRFTWRCSRTIRRAVVSSVS